MNAVLIAIVLLTRSKTTPKLWKQVAFAVSMVILIPSLLFLARRSRYYYQHVWSTIWVFAPVVVVVGVATAGSLVLAEPIGIHSPAATVPHSFGDGRVQPDSISLQQYHLFLLHCATGAAFHHCRGQSRWIRRHG